MSSFGNICETEFGRFTHPIEKSSIVSIHHTTTDEYTLSGICSNPITIGSHYPDSEYYPCSIPNPFLPSRIRTPTIPNPALQSRIRTPTIPNSWPSIPDKDCIIPSRSRNPKNKYFSPDPTQANIFPVHRPQDLNLPLVTLELEYDHHQSTPSLNQSVRENCRKKKCLTTDV